MTAVGLASFARLPREGAVGAVLTYVRAIRTGRAATTVAAGPTVAAGTAGPAIAGVGPTRAAGPTGPAVTSILTGGTG